MNKIGTDLKIVNGRYYEADILSAVEEVASSGLQGVNIRTLDEVSNSLDAGLLDEFAQLTTELGLYVEMGIGKVNPYMTKELPNVWALGDGNYYAGMVRMIETCALYGWTETWTALGGYKPYPAIFATDRFRTDAEWSDQLSASEAFLKKLAPVLRANGVHLNLETHEEVTSFELLRLIDNVGADVLGICLDPANLPVRGEVPLEAMARLAPHVRSTQLRDVALFHVEAGLARLLVPCGEGIIDWTEALDLILDARPEINLTIEGIGPVRAELELSLHDQRWWDAHPDLSQSSLRELHRLASTYEERSRNGVAATLEELRVVRHDAKDAHAQFVAVSEAWLRKILADRVTAAAQT